VPERRGSLRAAGAPVAVTDIEPSRVGRNLADARRPSQDRQFLLGRGVPSQA
jgi:hypothetical protein